MWSKERYRRIVRPCAYMATITYLTQGSKEVLFEHTGAHAINWERLCLELGNMYGCGTIVSCHIRPLYPCERGPGSWETYCKELGL